VLWALTAITLLLGDVWRVPHLLLSRHVVCGEHGELVHEHAAARHEPARSADDEVVPDGPTAHAHEHCAVLATATRAAALAPGSETSCVVAARPLVVALTFVPRFAPLGRAVLSYAPKQSPPV
jgi:hypothetical protein